MPQETFALFLFFAAIIIISLAIFYYLIKAAVKNAILEARDHQVTPVHSETKTYVASQDPYSPAQLALMAKYERNEISMKEYKSEWDKLK